MNVCLMIGMDNMKRWNRLYAVGVLALGFTLGGCGDEDETGTLSCELATFNQCFEWVGLSDQEVDSLGSTCVNDDGGVILESCPTENRIGTCEEVGDPRIPDLLNHFYLPSGQDEATYTSAKQVSCTEAGGDWKPV